MTSAPFPAQARAWFTIAGIYPATPQRACGLGERQRADSLKGGTRGLRVPCPEAAPCSHSRGSSGPRPVPVLGLRDRDCRNTPRENSHHASFKCLGGVGATGPRPAPAGLLPDPHPRDTSYGQAAASARPPGWSCGTGSGEPGSASEQRCPPAVSGPTWSCCCRTSHGTAPAPPLPRESRQRVGFLPAWRPHL